MDTRRLLLGDWHPLLRDGIDVLRLVLVVAAVVAGLTGNLRGLGYLGVGAAIALAARPVNLPRPYDLCLVLACCLQGFGEAFGLYDRYTWFDTVVHFTIPMLASPVIAIGLARLDVIPDPRDDTSAHHYVGLFVDHLRAGGGARRAVGADRVAGRPLRRRGPAARQRRHRRRPARRLPRRGHRRRAAGAVGDAQLGLRPPHPGREPLRGDRGARARRLTHRSGEGGPNQVVSASGSPTSVPFAHPGDVAVGPDQHGGRGADRAEYRELPLPV